MLRIQVEMAPIYEQFYYQLQHSIRHLLIKLDEPNIISPELLIKFKNPATKKVEYRIMDNKLGLFLNFPRPETFALYYEERIIFE